MAINHGQPSDNLPAPLDPALENKADQLISWITERAVRGVPPLSSAEDLAAEYISQNDYASADERVDALIKWESGKNFAAGFVTGLGGIATMPFAIPAAIGASWIIQARMAAAIARIYGHDLHDDKVITFILLTLLGGEAVEVLREVGVKVGNRLTLELIKKIPGRLLISINKKIGFRLLTKAGQTGVINLTKLVPIAGGVVGGAVDLFACQAVGRIAKTVFRPQPDSDGDAPASTGQSAWEVGLNNLRRDSREYQVFYSFGDGDVEVGADEALTMNISEGFPELLAQLTTDGDFLGIIDRDGNTLQMMYNADDDRYWIEIPCPENGGSYGCHMVRDQVVGLVEALPTRFALAMLRGAEFKQWG